MCGIWGIDIKSGSLTAGQTAILANNLAILNDTRGRDAWGVVTFKNGKYKIKRGLGLMGDYAYVLADHNKIMGHSRYGTISTNTIENAHPFKIGNIIGAHNGQIYNHHDLNFIYNRNHAVDSMHIFDHLDKNWNIDDMTGYGTIQWFRQDDPATIYLTRLKGGKLAVYGLGTPKNTYGTVWSSNWNHLVSALNRAGIKEYFRYIVKTNHVYYIKDHKYWITSNRLNLTKPEIKKPVLSQVNHFNRWLRAAELT